MPSRRVKTLWLGAAERHCANLSLRVILHDWWCAKNSLLLSCCASVGSCGWLKVWLQVWQLWNYDSVEPLILSVDEADEVPISEVVNTIARAMDFQVQLQSIPSFEIQLCRERSGSTRPRLMDSSRRLRRTGSCVRCCRISNLPTLKKGFIRRCNGLRPTMTLLGNDCLGLLPPSAIDAHMRLAHMLHEFVYQLSIVLFLNRVEDLMKS